MVLDTIHREGYQREYSLSQTRRARVLKGGDNLEIIDESSIIAPNQMEKET